MRKVTVMLLAIAAALPCDAYGQIKRQADRQEYRDAMEQETRTDYTGSEQLREDRRDMLRQGVPLEQVQQTQMRQIEEKRMPPASAPGSAGQATGVTVNSPFAGFYSPPKKNQPQTKK